ncbi:hypothetical protein H310_05714 [Aphanomyces invadans]|uniref:Uncharacterized protein n=1 Tax=Aphanomyces invadans TaxID=157072 RepID=A0A024U6T2_9STRA|nr:hypothetical protein H310_05714 [Aphanomyces invadans]ETW02141.1 hypothetical protein H310_05714 [Aphanomyces invadans]|eukprot:XP_008868746.1 hypothetical protein H310_05714 [Aphanomyces invadans]
MVRQVEDATQAKSAPQKGLGNEWRRRSILAERRNERQATVDDSARCKAKPLSLCQHQRAVTDTKTFWSEALHVQEVNQQPYLSGKFGKSAPSGATTAARCTPPCFGWQRPFATSTKSARSFLHALPFAVLRTTSTFL